MTLPAVINHREVCPSGSCDGELVQRGPHDPSWECVQCEAEYFRSELLVLSGCYNHKQYYRHDQEARQDLSM